jgi:8-oxo-dGTP pyrophosphatase MutT (NUDIX family)/dephospho-CoA kinase
MTAAFDKGDLQKHEIPTYARLRFERLVKLTRDAVAAIRVGELKRARDFLQIIRLYADLLAQALLEGKYSRVAEARMLRQLQLHGEHVERLRPRTEWIIERFSSDWDMLNEAPLQRLQKKKGAIALPQDKFEEWKQWLASRPLGSCDCAVGILSRGLTDAAIAGRIYGIPVRYICYSRRRLEMPSVELLDCEWCKHYECGRVVLIDAHAQTGKTIRQCCDALFKEGVPLAGVLITEDETSQSSNFVGLRPSKPDSVEGVKWKAWVKNDALSYVNKAENKVAPLISLCGYPGSGKTLVRKVLAKRTGWPTYSWGRTVRKFLAEEFGGNSMEAVQRLTTEETSDPEIVAREFLVKEDLALISRSTPVVIDGLKSLRALQCLKRHLGREAMIVRVFREPSLRLNAINDRGDFDDGADRERTVMLENIGLDTLLNHATIHIDASDSDVVREEGAINLGRVTAAGIDTIITQVCISPFAAKSETAAFLLLAPDENLFLVLRSATSGKWGLAGGHVEMGEGLWEAAVRELFEETGLEEPEEIQLCDPFTMQRIVEQSHVTLWEKVSTIFVARALSRAVRLSSEHLESRWVSAEEAAELLSAPINILPGKVLSLVRYSNQ